MADDPTPDEIEDTAPLSEEPDDTSEPEESADAEKPEPKPAPKPAPPKDTWKPPTKTEFEALQAKLREANRESADRRKKLDALQREKETEQEKAIREAREAALLESKPRIVRAEARVALAGADARPERIAALTRFLDLDKIEVDGDDVTGLEEQITALKGEYPEFFRQPEPDPGPEPKKPTPRIPVGRKAPADKPRTIGEQIVARQGY